MIVFLHPVFTAVFIALMVYSFLEVNHDRSYKSAWWVVGFMIFLLGFRDWAGADYGVYARLFEYYGKMPYAFVFNKDIVEMEWLYVLLGKVIYDAKLPFFIYTFIIALIALISKYMTFEKVVYYPAMAMLLYMIPTYFIADGGQMRQGVAMGLLMLSFLYIRERRLLMFLFVIYMAMGFHKSAFVFIFAYWIAIIPLNPTRILLLILISVILSPFQVYSYISLLDSIAPEEVYEGFQSYETIEEANKSSVKLYDLISIFYTYFLVVYNKEACERIPYYEYMRNISVVGICMYFIFRGSPIFSSRLSINYFIFMIMVLPSIVAAVQKPSLKKGLHLVIMGFIVFYYFVFAYMQGVKLGYTWEGYGNYFW
ncbi:MAG: EpsG family protein [Flavobacteriaceae bacterium]|nr:EpsG family protein [Flavobacteriaceae bacterium]